MRSGNVLVMIDSRDEPCLNRMVDRLCGEARARLYLGICEILETKDLDSRRALVLKLSESLVPKG